MFFEQDNIGFMITDVLQFTYGKAETYNTGRKIHALSYRFEADTLIEIKRESTEEIHHLTNDAITYIPANMDYLRKDKYDKMIVVHFQYFGYINDNIEYFYPQNAEVYKEKFTKLLSIWKTKEIGYKMKAASVLYEIFALIYYENRPQITQNGIINNAVEYLLANYQNPDLTIKMLSDISHISEVYFRKLFKAKYGISPKSYMKNLRIKYAAELLTSGYHRISEVSEMSGFTDYRYFSSEFKKYTGVSPSKYY